MTFVYWCIVIKFYISSYSLFQCLLSSTMIAKIPNSSSQSSLFFTVTNHKIPAHVGVCLITIIIIKNDVGH